MRYISEQRKERDGRLCHVIIDTERNLEYNCRIRLEKSRLEVLHDMETKGYISGRKRYHKEDWVPRREYEEEEYKPFPPS